MNRLARFALDLHSWMLRLYPSRFRAEYADEMRTVFGLALEEANNALSLLDLLVSELRDLPLSVIRAHVEERSENTNHILEGGIIVASGNSARTFRLCTLGTLMGIVIYLLIVVMPFFVLGIHLQPADQVATGDFDPTNPTKYPLYGYFGEFGTSQPTILWMATLLVLLVTPFLEMVLGSSLFIMLLRNRTLFPQKQQLIGRVAAFASISLILFAASPLGRLIMGWWVD
jgi:hypothetical protein